MTAFNKIFLIPMILLLMAFQCNRSIKYARQTEVELTPNEIPITGDSINFRIDIKTTDKVINRCSSLTFNLYLIGEDSSQLIDKLTVNEKHYNTRVKKQNNILSNYSYIGLEMICDKKAIKTNLMFIGSLKHEEKNAP